MKKLFLLLTGILVFFVSCNQNEDLIENEAIEKQIKTPRLYALKRSEMLTRSVANSDVLWENGQTIRVKFLNGTVSQHNLVKQYSIEWLEYANLEFEFVDENDDADVKIAFDWKGDKVNWSYYGNEAKSIKQFQASTNFANLPTFPLMARSEILRQFGHILGLLPEHNNPNSPIEWNKEYIYDYYKYIDPVFWSKAAVDDYFFKAFNNTKQTDFDKNSIMIWDIEDFITNNNVKYSKNNKLSDQDKELISKLYPKKPLKIIAYRTDNFMYGSSNEYEVFFNKVKLEDPDILACYIIGNEKRKDIINRLDLNCYFGISEQANLYPNPSSDTVVSAIFLKKDIEVIRQNHVLLRLAQNVVGYSSTGLLMLELKDKYIFMSTCPSPDKIAYENLELINSEIVQFMGDSQKKAILIGHAGAWYDPKGETPDTIIKPEDIINAYLENWNLIQFNSYHSGYNNNLSRYGWVNLFVSINNSIIPDVLRTDKYSMTSVAPRNGAILISEIKL